MQEVIKEFGLREAVGAESQTYALGLKEVWEVGWTYRAECVLHRSIVHDLVDFDMPSILDGAD